MNSSFARALLFVLLVCSASAQTFVPKNRVSGIGIARDDLSDLVLDARTEQMVQTQTFSIMREPMAVAGARRVASDSKLQQIFRSAAASSGFPQSVLEAIAYLESWGDAKAVSPAGPRGIMQISEATARTMGLSVRKTTRYRVVKEKVTVLKKGKKKPSTVTVKRRIPYTVVSRDDRMLPERAIPAAARYLAGMEERLGGRDWAIFAYHCGQGCAIRMQELTRNARGIPRNNFTVARMFFSASPVWNRELYEAVERQMQRDYSPTYWFRVMRAEQLLELYRRDSRGFSDLAAEYKSDFNHTRAPHRLAVWLRTSDLVYRDAETVRADLGKKILVKAFNRPEYFGYSLRGVAESTSDLDALSEASPAAIGTLTYVAFETRRLFDLLKPAGQIFQPLEVTSLLQSEEDIKGNKPEALTHASGQVFDIDCSSLSPEQLECLRFVLDDLGWAGYVGFVEEGPNVLHVGASPSAREFFTSVFEDASGL